MRSRTLIVAAVTAAMAFGSVAAEQRRIRPVMIYLTSGLADGDCSPTILTTRAVGQSSCGPINPTGGSTTWTVDMSDDGFPALVAGDQEAEVTIAIGDGTGLGLPGSWEITVEVELTGDFTLAATETVTFDSTGGDMLVEFTIPVPEEGFIDGGRVTVTGSGAGLPVGYSVDGEGGSYIRMMPPTD